MDPEPPGPFEELMLRGEKLRALRLMALADEEERNRVNEEDVVCTEEDDQMIMMLPLDAESSASLKIPSASVSSPSIVNIDFLQHGMPANDSMKDLSETTVSTSGASSIRVILEDKVDVLPDSRYKVLRYESYLAHQRYHDDYKHSNCDFIDFKIENTNQRVFVEQQRYLGKGGLLWDAGVILAEHVVNHESEWKVKGMGRMTRIVDLGAGVGFTGIVIAKSVPHAQVTITDLPELLPLMKRNVERNFDVGSILEDLSKVESKTYENRGEAAQDIPCHTDKGCKVLSPKDNIVLYDVSTEMHIDKVKQASGQISAAVLRWGVKEDYINAPYDVVVAADVVASLYCPKALAQTIHDLCHDETRVYISLKKRLTEPLVIFEGAMQELFQSVKRCSPILSRRKNDDIIVMEATGKR